MATKTAAQQRQLAKAEFDAYLAQCPSRRLLDRVSDKWVTLIICALRDGELRFSELARQIAGVSQKMLTQTLRTLERDGLVARRVTASVPVRVDYSLTPLGSSLLGPIELMKDWAEQHMPDVDAARAEYDARG
ncbi:ArsR family transcriptional regulator [Epidermidibacterium keratini]|uniref:ArsR family transcriptional regulator n=1 Tax=Epidermidibacterium keratini TaxID=1891644 RepID=A0A7L4YPR1_9ACTN|nr:helix-turn-helix domain-containing protein [Epidermidibacterium keratini]QHC00893.1 ArsR family transcriptional regulator [Epidermidibacterium keratini]